MLRGGAFVAPVGAVSATAAAATPRTQVTPGGWAVVAARSLWETASSVHSYDALLGQLTPGRRKKIVLCGPNKS